MQFGEFAGNEAVKAQLSAAMDAGRLPHALLLEGEPGSGRRTLAMQVARAVVCRAGRGEEHPCGVCAACIKSAHPDITCLGGDGAPLTVDAIRRLREEAFLLPNESEKRVMVLADANTMTPQAQNALLKILEEPPAHVVFILTCESRVQVLETIRSRCVCLTLSPVDWDEAAPVLRRRLPRVEEEELRRAHELFGGRIGRVIDGVSDGTFARVLELVPLFAQALTDAYELPLVRLTARLEKDKELAAGVLAGLQLVVRDALVLRYGGGRLLSTAPEQARRLSSQLTAGRLSVVLEQCDRLQQDLRRNMNNTLFLTRLSACLRQAAGY